MGGSWSQGRGRAVERIRTLETELAGPPPLVFHEPPRTGLGERLLLLAGAAVFAGCVLLARGSGRAVLLFLAPSLLGLMLWFALLPRYALGQEPTWWRRGMWVVFIAGLAAGVYLDVR